MRICKKGYNLQRPPLRCRSYNQSDFCKGCQESRDVYTSKEVMEAINNLKDWDNYEPFHEQVDQVLYMFTHMEKEN